MLVLLDMRNQFLFQVRPSLFPEGELTPTEVLLWELYYTDKKDKENG